MHVMVSRPCDHSCGLRSLVQHAAEQAEVPHSTMCLHISSITALDMQASGAVCGGQMLPDISGEWACDLPNRA